MRRELAAQTRKHPTHVLGFSTNMHELMAVADLIITKPGGLTTSEALALGKPLFILNPIPGQEAANSDFLLERGAAAKVNRVEDLPFRIETTARLEETGRNGQGRQIAGPAAIGGNRLPGSLETAGLNTVGSGAVCSFGG